MRHFLASISLSVIFAAVLALAGCGDDTSPPASRASTSTSSTPDKGGAVAPAVTSLADAMAQAEASGSYPRLDRSTSLAGPDANQNGIRDDIDAWIAAQAGAASQKAALRQMARSFQETYFIDTSDSIAVQAAAIRGAAAVVCINTRYGTASNSLEGTRKRRLLRSMTFNTIGRTRAYFSLDQAISGHVIQLPTSEEACDD